MSYLAIEGLIGAGKSTLARWIADKTGWNLLPEPVEENKVLPLFYEDPVQYGFTMQIAMLMHRYRQQQVAGHSHVPCVLDRSLPGDRVFAKMLHRSGTISDIEWEVYQDAYRAMSMVRPPFLMAFLEVDPEVAYTRIQERARTVESGISLDYLRDLDHEYEDLLREIESGHHHWSRGINVLRVPWNGHYPDLNNSPAEDILAACRRYVEDR